MSVRCLKCQAQQTNPVRGMKDRFGSENVRFNWITEKGAKFASLYGFDQITTPTLEYSQVFERTLGDDSDVVGKELYSFEDKGGSRLTMRPEGTAGITRALISQKLYNELPQKYYYYGPMFRHERPQKGRLRQLEINSLGDSASRHNYKSALKDYLSSHTDGLSQDSINRLSTNPLRILDSKAPQDIQILENSPILSDYLSDASQKRFAFITEALSLMNIPFTVNPKLVRGLDYYQDTVFEFKVSSPLLGAQQGTVLAGGRYDGLVEKMGGPAGVSSIGWAAGLERLSLLLNEQNIPSRIRPVAIIPVPDRTPSDHATSVTDTTAPSTTALHSHAMAISSALRQEGVRVEFIHLTSSSSTKSQLPKQLAKASKLKASHALLIGTDEMKKGIVTFKDLDKAEQKQCRVDDVVNELRALYAIK
ncbi:hypothetical protein BGZ51_001853 [Haplosporangium sp. Z 767]|nr:hypothetical protein BGZ51_001853 [Haplosporangium sp. Z 767]